MSSDLEKSKFYILFIDDEEKAVKYFQKIFEKSFNVIATTDPDEIFRIIDNKSHEIAVVVSDQKMPITSGVDLLTAIKEKNRNIIRIITTAYASLENNIAAINKSNVFAYLSKPWNIEEATKIFYDALEEYESNQNYLGLSGSIAHEMRNPLSNMRQSAKLVKERLSNAHQNERFCGFDKEKITPLTGVDFEEIVTSLDAADNSAKRGSALIDIILNNIGNKVVDIDNFTDLKISSVLRKMIEEYSFKEGERERVSVEIESKHDFSFRGEETAIIFIFINLLKNSLYYSSYYSDLRIKIRVESGSDNFNRIYIKDNGPGIPEDKLEGLFADFSTSGKRDGTGLGLSFCKKTMKSIGGDILCRSKEKEFAEFILEFPISIKEVLLEKSEKKVINKVLLVDDQLINIMTIGRLLEKNLHSTSCDQAENGVEAVKMAKENHYDVIIMDIEMPKMDGIHATKEIRKFNKTTPIIAYSSKILESLHDDLKDAGFNGYIFKEAPHPIILKIISRWGVVKLTDSSLKKESIGNFLQKKKILLADDEEINLLLTSKYLTSHKAKVEKARDGAEALEMVKHNNYDLIIMDIQMPNVDGISAIQEIRKFQQENNLPLIPVIAMTGDSEKAQIHKLLNAGFDDYFTKGEDYDDLSNILSFWNNARNNNLDLFTSFPQPLYSK